ncbi:MAG: neutral/alkaline non-lysosomal ceramidase N-terminal domain-containing protein [Promethearchaeota archaeon]
MLKAGFQEVIITGPIGTTALAGYGGLKNTARGINDQLLANCVVLNDGSKTIAIVSLDLVGLLPDTVTKIRELANELTDGAIETKDILISCTHTHSGPDTIGIFYPQHMLEYRPDELYLGMLVRQVAGSILGAYNKLKDVKLKIGRNLLWDGSANRREGSLPPNPVSPRTIDPEVNVLYFEGDDGPSGAIINFAAHATSFPTGRTLLMSADYIGVVRDEIKKKLGRQFTVVYLNGFCGDIAPKVLSISPGIRPVKIKSRDNKVVLEGFGDFCEKLGLHLADFKAFQDVLLNANPRFASLSHEFEIEEPRNSKNIYLRFSNGKSHLEWCKRYILQFIYHSIGPGYIRVGMKIANSVFAILDKLITVEKEVGIDCLTKTVNVSIDDPEMANEGLFESYMKRQGDKIYSEVDVQAIRIGPVLILTMPGEPVNEIQLRLKSLIRQQSEFEYILAAELANGNIGYILTPEEYDMMGYEFIISFGRNNAPLLEKAILKLVSKLGGKEIIWRKNSIIPYHEQVKGEPKLRDLIIMER